MNNLAQNYSAASDPLLSLTDLARRARHAGSLPELRFLLVNDTHALVPYRQSALWIDAEGVKALSGVVQIEANAPYALWLDKVCRHCADTFPQPAEVDAAALPAELAPEWSDWLPAHAFWLPVAAGRGSEPAPPGGLLLARDHAWSPQETFLLAEWVDAWTHAWHAGQAGDAGVAWRRWWRRVSQLLAKRQAAPAIPDAPVPPWWKRRAWHWAAGAFVVAVLPVRLTVLAPGELVPARPDVIRAPLEGVVEAFHVQPNQAVKQGQPLFGFDEALIRSRLEVARQALATAESEYRQSMQQALTDPRAKAMLSLLTGRIEEKRAEADFIRAQLTRAQVLSPRDGVVLFDDPTEWIGRPVTVGERIMRVAAPEDIEVEAWVGVADAIPLPSDAAVSVYLNATPLAPVQAKLRYVAHDAVQRPDGTYAYRLRATLTEPTSHRVGLKGTARVDGRWVPLIYWAVRRPWAGIRSLLGW